MKKQNTVIAIAGLLTLVSSVAFAGAPSSERGLENMIQKNAVQKNADDARKYERVSALAGERRNELAAKREETITTYKKWQELKAAAETSRSDAAIAKAVQAGEKHAQANKEFVELQKDILLKASNSTSVAEAINALNAAEPTAAGR